MKKFLSCLLFAALSSSFAAPASASQPPSRLQALSFDGTRKEEIRSARLLFRVYNEQQEPSLLMIRAKAGKKVRLDSISSHGIFSICQNDRSFWHYDPENGSGVMEPEDAADMLVGVAFLPLPCYHVENFTKITAAGEASVRGMDCCCWTTSPVKNPAIKYSLWTDKKNGRIRQIKCTDLEGAANISFRDYKKVNGVWIPSSVVVAGTDGRFSMELQAADWNLVLDDVLFQRGDPNKDPSLALIKKSFSAPEAKKILRSTSKSSPASLQKTPGKGTSARQKNIDRLEREIRTLRIQIAANEKRLDQLESVFRADRKDALDAAKSGSHSRVRYYRSWGYYGGGYSRSSRQRIDPAQRKIAKGLYKESSAIAREYDKLSRELTAQRIKLSDDEMELERLTGRRDASGK